MRKRMPYVQVLFLLFALAPSRAFAETTAPPSPGRFSMELHLWHALTFGGHVQVRENAIEGDKLSLPADLGMESLTGLELDAGLRLGAKSRLRLSVSDFLFEGSSILPRD